MKDKNIFALIDKPLLIMYLLLVFIGWVNIFVASYDFEQSSIFNLSYRSGMQFIWICVSLSTAMVLILLDKQIYSTFAYFFYGGIILLLLLTIFIAPDIKGSRSWLVLGPISIQPAEFAKFTTALALAKLMSSYEFTLKTAKGWIRVIALILFPLTLIILQKETGSALIFLSFVVMLYREGLPGLVPLLGFMAVLLFIIVIRFGGEPLMEVPDTNLGLFIAMLIIICVQIAMTYTYTRNKQYLLVLVIGYATIFTSALLIHFLFTPLNFVYVALIAIIVSVIYTLFIAIKSWRITYFLLALFAVGFVTYSFSAEYLFEDVLKPHQQMRIKVMLGMENDPTGVGYNVIQSRIAIGSGGFTGKGFLNGTQTKLKYVPEQDTDFVFCTIGEETGFIGSALIVALYIIFMMRLVTVSERQNTIFARIYGYCVLGIFLFHVTINIGMVLGLAPVIGIPLPFFSYGGSSLLAFTILLFILLKLDTYNKE